jgi:hypothetical protein
VHKAVGEFISTFKSKQHVMQRLYRARAKMKMYAENSPHAHGHELTMFRAAEQQVLQTGEVIQKLTTKLQQTGLKIIREDEHVVVVSPRPTTSPKEVHSGAPHDVEANSAPKKGARILNRLVSDAASVYFNIDAPAVCAFLVFEYTESFARCLNDYERFAHFPWSLAYPNELKFRGTHKIKVRRAPEPDQVSADFSLVLPCENLLT